MIDAQIPDVVHPPSPRIKYVSPSAGGVTSNDPPAVDPTRVPPHDPS